ncbi:hypothetical protein DV701_14600 [Ornithinimicrobium avium]|uniref:Thioredoxin domain-containing protein n=2 Tax=Ornithinimicrobium avium TaxID=2283195 RepID=A0A345NQ73_9MICO|nr:hypothetical protein DV701_14600 [Ornithinimicrobium avium]
MESAVLLAWVALVLLALGLAGLLRQVTVLSRSQAGRPGDATATGAAPRSTRDLLGFRLPTHGDLAGLVAPGAGRTVVAFVSPGCPSCVLTLRGLADVPELQDGTVHLVAVSSGSCEAAAADLPGTGRCVEQGRPLMEQLHVPATPYLMEVDGGGTIVAATLPGPDTDLAAWVRRTPGRTATKEHR